MIKIVKGSDRFLWLQIIKDPGLFQFSDDNVANVTCVLYDSAGSQIASYSKTGSTLVFVILSYDDKGNYQSTASDDSNIFEIKLIGTTTTGKTTGRMKAKITITITNVNFPDSTYDVIIPEFESDYYLIPNL